MIFLFSVSSPCLWFSESVNNDMSWCMIVSWSILSVYKSCTLLFSSFLEPWRKWLQSQPLKKSSIFFFLFFFLFFFYFFLTNDCLCVLYVLQAAPYLEEAEYDTGNHLEDLKAHSLIQQLVHNPKLQAACPLPFDEAKLWQGQSGPELKQQIQKQFRNIRFIFKS